MRSDDVFEARVVIVLCSCLLRVLCLPILIFHFDIYFLQVIGNASALTQSEDWAALLADAKDRGCFVSSTTCIQRGLLPEPAVGPLGALGSPGLLHPRPGGPSSRGRGTGASHGGRHPSSGRLIYLYLQLLFTVYFLHRSPYFVLSFV